MRKLDPEYQPFLFLQMHGELARAGFQRSEDGEDQSCAWTLVDGVAELNDGATDQLIRFFHGEPVDGLQECQIVVTEEFTGLRAGGNEVALSVGEGISQIAIDSIVELLNRAAKQA